MELIYYPDSGESFFNGSEEPVVFIFDDDGFIFQDPKKNFLSDITWIDVVNDF